MKPSSRASYHPEARDEVVEAARFYAAEDRALGQAFRNAVKAAEKLILSGPQRWPPYLAGTRRYILRRYPFSVVYTVEADGRIFVVAVAHQKRKPGYWMARVS
jgi:plasmid stabilization system protein ParE